MSEEHIQVPPPLSSSVEVNGPGNGSVGTTVTVEPAPASPGAPGKSGPVESKDSPREIIETIVFVIVLVLLLKSFVAEAFVIPTGSMAETLWGYQKKVECPQCRYTFPVNCSSEVEPPASDRRRVTECTCPNCRFHIELNDSPRPETGDRVLVDKSLYDLLEEPSRFDVVVFKYPEKPQDKQVPMNYIKRLVGQPGETIAIYGGDLYRTTDLNYQHHPSSTDTDDLRRAVHENDPEAHKLFGEQREVQFEKKIQNRGFEIVRKSPDKALALRRIVFDRLPRTTSWPAGTLGADAAWARQREHPRFEHNAAALNRLTYRHICQLRRPQLVTDLPRQRGRGKVRAAAKTGSAT